MELPGGSLPSTRVELHAAANYDMAGDHELNNEFWKHPDTRFILKLETRMKGNGFESFTTQLVEPAPGPAIEKPE